MDLNYRVKGILYYHGMLIECNPVSIQKIGVGIAIGIGVEIINKGDPDTDSDPDPDVLGRGLAFVQ